MPREIVALLFCLLLAGCASTGWQDVKPHYDSAHLPTRYEFSDSGWDLAGIWGSADRTQFWAVGQRGIILHYSGKAGRWEEQDSSTAKFLFSIFGSSDGTQLWAVGENGTILHYSGQAGRWEKQDSGTTDVLYSIFGSSDGTQLWAVGENGTILHYSGQAGRWEKQDSGTPDILYSIFGKNDGAQLWAVGENGTILHYSRPAGRWEKQDSGTTDVLHAVFGRSDGAQLWAVGGNGIILHYSRPAGRWEKQDSGTTDVLYSIFWRSDGTQLWAVGENGTILHYSGLWKAQSSSTTNVLHAVFGSSNGAQLWAVGESGTILHYSGLWKAQSSSTTDVLHAVFGSRDGTQLWAVGENGTILHYSSKTGLWKEQDSGTHNALYSIFGSSDGAQLWAVGENGTILHYSGLWKAQSSSATDVLHAVFGSSDGTQLWAVGENGTILHYSSKTGLWKEQDSGTRNALYSIFGSRNGAQLWAVGTSGTILYYSGQTGRWEKRDSGTTNVLSSISGSSDGAQLWAVGTSGTILYYSGQTGRWEKQTSGTTKFLSSVSGSSDGAQLWAVGENGTILHGTKTTLATYISDVNLLAKPSRASLQVHVSDNQKRGIQSSDLTLYGLSKRSFEKGSHPLPVNSAAQPPTPSNGFWVFDFNPADIAVDPDTETHLRIVVKQGRSETNYDVDLTYDPYHIFRKYWAVTFAAACAAAMLVILVLLLFFRPLWILYLYRWLKIYNLVEQIEVPAVGKLLQALLKLTMLPRFVTHPRTLRAWVNANHKQAKDAWDTSLKMLATRESGATTGDVPYVALPVQIENGRNLNPTPEGFDSLFGTGRNVIQIVGRGGAGKTALAKHIGDLALRGGKGRAFKACRLPIWIDEDLNDLQDVLKRKINSWDPFGEDIEETLLNALLKNGLLLVIVDRISERSQTTQDYLRTVHGKVRCNAMLITTRKAIEIDVAEQRFVYPQPLDLSALPDFISKIIEHYSQGSDNLASLSTQPQEELKNRLADLITVKIDKPDGAKEIDMLPLLVVLFVSEAVALAKSGCGLDALPKSQLDVYASYLKRINSKISGMSDEDMLRAARVLAKLAVEGDYIPKEFEREDGLERLKAELPGLLELDPLGRLVANGALLSRPIGSTSLLRFALDPAAEFLAAEAHFDQCEGKDECLRKLLLETENAQGFNNALLLTMDARRARRSS